MSLLWKLRLQRWIENAYTLKREIKLTVLRFRWSGVLDLPVIHSYHLVGEEKSQKPCCMKKNSLCQRQQRCCIGIAKSLAWQNASGLTRRVFTMIKCVRGPLIHAGSHWAYKIRLTDNMTCNDTCLRRNDLTYWVNRVTEKNIQFDSQK